MEVHSVLGPGLLEGAYEECLVYELRARALACRRQVVLPIHYKGLTVGHGFRADLLVSDSLLVELKAVESILPVHQAQILTYLRLSRRRMGLLINFHARHLRDGIQRFVVDPPRDASVL